MSAYPHKIEFRAIEVRRIIARVLPGCRLDQAIADAGILALSEWRVVDLCHNQTIYTIDPAKYVKGVIDKEGDAE